MDKKRVKYNEEYNTLEDSHKKICNDCNEYKESIEIKNSDGFKKWYNDVIIPRIKKQTGYLYFLFYDNTGDQWLLPDDDPRSHIYQYKKFLNNNA